MKIGLKWLNSYLDRPIAAEEAERVLTDVGFPLESVERRGDDAVLDVEVTSNRPDCLSHLGVAREIAAATGRSVKESDVEPLAEGPAAESLASVENRETSLCPLYTARVITGVKVGPSPRWLAERLESIEVRPVNNVVDVTNFVLHELGQPLHAFDLDKLDGRRVMVRRAEQGEPFMAIDGSKHALRPEMLVIADAVRPQAVAGIMGGIGSEVSATTTDVLLESARFDPLSVRTTGRALGLKSDSSYRFERGVDPHGVERASRRAAKLILETAGGTLAGGAILAGEKPAQPLVIRMRTARCNALLGVELTHQRISQLLASLGLSPRVEGDVIACTLPSFRLDLKREVDLIEEVARLHGLGSIPVEPKMRIVVRPPQKRIRAREAIARVLTAHGYFEAITFSFIDPKFGRPFADEVELVEVNQEKKRTEPALRPSLLPSLLACRKSNQDAGNKNVRLFEVAQAFGRRDGRYVEWRQLALLADGPGPDALRDLRATIEELLAALGLPAVIEPIEITSDPTAWAQPMARIRAIDCGFIGRYGPATPSILKLFDLQTPVVMAELDHEELISEYPPEPRPSELPKFPAIERDLSLAVDEAVSWQSIDRIVQKVKPALLEQVEFITVYRGKPVPPGRKSVTLRLTFRDPARTLKHEEVSEQVNAVVATMTKELNAELRV